MFVDIHSHKLLASDSWVVYNIPLAQADAVFATDEKVLFSVGFHPCMLETFSPERMEKMKEWAADTRFVAIGECGLDKNSETSLEKQIKIFEKQVLLSEEKQKPLIIHCVGRFNELFELKRQWNPKQTWIIHGFRGKPQLAEQALKAGCSLSFGEYFNSESVRLTSLEKLFVESDESNMPIVAIYANVAKARNCSVNELNAGEKLLEKMKFKQIN